MRADKLIQQVRFRDQPKRTVAIENPNIHVSGHFDNTNIIGELKPHWRDLNGHIAARGFYLRGKLFGLFDESYKDLVKIAEEMQKKTTPRNVLGTGLLSEKIFEWVKQRFKGITMPTMTEYVLSECEKHIVEAEIWIPISNLHLERPFKLGSVTFKVITKDFMDDYEESVKSRIIDPTVIKDVEARFERKRAEIQNRAVAILWTEAEKGHAYDIALEQTERAMSILRFFSPTNLVPTQICYSAPLEKQHLDGDVYMVVKDGKVLQEVSGTSDRSFRPWVLRSNDLIEYMKTGLETLSKLLLREKLTDFQEKLLESLFIYSKASLAKNVSDRLVYTLVALETIFVKDRQEPLQDNISLRMAQMHPVSIKERREIVANFRKTYAIRSRIIHHGKNLDLSDLEILGTFMLNTWISIQALFQLAELEFTNSKFFEWLDDRRIGG